jgi:hypothetical protein
MLPLDPMRYAGRKRLLASDIGTPPNKGKDKLKRRDPTRLDLRFIAVV